MAVAKVELVYDDAKKNRMIDVVIKSGLKGTRFLNAVERGVEKVAKDDKDWTRWNLIGVDEQGGA